MTRQISEAPLVSCIMPTCDRRLFAKQAIEYFRRQDYPNRELIVVDDGADGIEDLLQGLGTAVYIRGDKKRNVGDKRNLACEAASGPLIAHWDDDDWYASTRLSEQVGELRKGGAQMVGLQNLLYYDIRRGKGFRYVHTGQSRWLSMLCYERQLWQRQRYGSRRMGEDTAFVRGVARSAVRVLSDEALNVCMIHGANTAPKQMSGRRWRHVPVEVIRGVLGEDWDFYVGAECVQAASTRSRMSTSSPRTARSPRRGPTKTKQRADPRRVATEALVPTVARSHAPGRAGLAVTIVLPTHASGAALLERTLGALELQTLDNERFEVVVTVDGGDPEGLAGSAARPLQRPFACRLVDSPRPKGDVAHRNHARNAGCSVARGEILWVLDADFLLPPHALEHLLTEHQSSLASGMASVFTPCLGTLSAQPDDWLESSAAFARDPTLRSYQDLLGGIALTGREYSGFFGRYRAQERPASQLAHGLKEGFPTCWRSLWAALGGYDEAFIGYGGNKEEFVRRLVALSRGGQLQMRLLSSVLAMHQPHPPDPHRRASSAMRVANTRHFRRRLRDMQRMAPWWQQCLQRSTAALEALTSDCVEVDPG